MSIGGVDVIYKDEDIEVGVYRLFIVVGIKSRGCGY